MTEKLYVLKNMLTSNFTECQIRALKVQTTAVEFLARGHLLTGGTTLFKESPHQLLSILGSPL